MNTLVDSLNCSECNSEVPDQPTIVEYHDQEIHLFDPVICPDCLLRLCGKYSVPCVNCGDPIPPYTQVGVLKADGGTRQLVHMTTSCNTVGSAFHGYLGKGELRDFIQIEAC